MVAIVAFVAVLVVRLVDIQVVRADSLDAQSAAQSGDVATIYGSRGQIVDANGVVLADSVMRYDVAVSPVDAKSFPRQNKAGKEETVTRSEAIAEIAAATGQNAGDLTSIVTKALKSDPKSQYALLASSVDVGTFNKLNALDIPWLYFASHPARTYPEGAVAGNLVGYVNSNNQMAGLEAAENSCLAGSNGQETYQQSEDGVTIPGSTKVTKKAKDGGTLVTTIDSNLQYFAQQQLAQVVPSLGAQFGMVTVTDVKTGDIKVQAQWPSVDPNNIGATPQQYQGDMFFQNTYEPGSTFKALTASALVDAGYATPESQVLAPYTFTTKDVKLSDSSFHTPEKLTLTGVLMESSNTGISILGQKMPDDARYDYLKKFGIGTATEVNFPAQSSGILNPPSEWDAQTKYATMFGQGVSATPAQMMQAYQTIANGGVKVPLKLIKGCKQADGTMTDVPAGKQTRVISSKTASTVLDMLESVVDTGEVSDALHIPGYEMAAKTGTAQEPDGNGGYQPYYYVSVMGVAPVDDPQYVVSVNIGYPTTITSSAAAAPLWRTIMSQVLQTYRVKPSTIAPANYPPFY
jgi:cell division protein FtsI (penicillin-binding protein 3)